MSTEEQSLPETTTIEVKVEEPKVIEKPKPKSSVFSFITNLFQSLSCSSGVPIAVVDNPTTFVHEVVVVEEKVVEDSPSS